MATSIELENVGRERYMVKDVEAKIQVDRISKELKALEVDDKDFYVCVNRNVESKFIKDDESKEEKIDQFVVKHRETITVVQGLANTKLTNPDKWIIKIKKELSETTLFKGKEIIDKISQRQEKLERNSLSPIVKAAIANANQKEENNCFELSSDDDYKIKLELERESSKINKEKSSIYAKEEAGAEAGKQRVREVFHTDVAELIIERDA